MNDQPAGNPGITTPSIDIEERIAQYLQLRDRMTAMKKDLEERLKPYNEARAMMQSLFLAWLADTKQTSATTEAGNIHILDKVSATIEDGDIFRKWIVENEHWHLVDWKANAPRVQEWVAENDGAIPPGIKYSVYRTAGVRRS